MAEDNPSQASDNAAPETKSAGAGKKGERILLGLLVASFLWYLLADRYTPYTTQARLQSYVVGVAPQVAGIVDQVHVDNNQMVKEGEPLFSIDSSQYDIALAQAQSQLDNTWQQIEAGNASVQAARAALDAALADEVKAEKDLNRLTRLHDADPGTISVRRLESSQASLESAHARVEKARADIDRAIYQKGGDNDKDNAMLRAAQAAVDKAELDLSHTVVYAPVSGIITDLRTDVGHFAGTGSPVMTLLANQDIWINADYTENNLRFLNPGDEVEILFDAMPGHVFDGVVASIGLGVSSGRTPPAGSLPTIDNDRDWLRQAQRFPVVIRFDVNQNDALPNLLRTGGQASVITYSSGGGPLKWIGQIYIRVMSVFSFLY